MTVSRTVVTDYTPLASQVHKTTVDKGHLRLVGMAKKRKITIGEGGPGATDGGTDGRTRHFLVALRHYEALFFFAEREECGVFGVGRSQEGTRDARADRAQIDSQRQRRRR